ncbi:uncharacterized protein LOC116950447 isoform X1 [Petromyzon marinus]|uniref:Zinc finger and BTB domain-containing protein 39-like isoform X1 n=2 Tax=Petromyzon marinus TaxID=7757 RepID=A0AAJ7TTZ5_PETMA|nr:zinc finger and BTB domain-containing protein 39-like isoform X1 [Petromyzon marinus]
MRRKTPAETGAGRCGEAERVAMAEGADGAEEETFQLASNKQLSDLLRELCELRERGSFCDVVVEVQSCRYLAHKAVLSSTCRYFRSLFLSAPCSSMGPFVVDFLSIRTFELIVDFIYKGRIRASRDEMRGLYCAALDLGLECLEEACRPFKSETDDWGDGSAGGESDEGSDVRMSVVEMQRAEETQEAPTAAVDLSGRQACATVTATATIKHRMWNRELEVAACRSVPRDQGGDAADASTPLLLDVKEEPFSASENGDDDCNGDYNGASAETPPPGGDSTAPPAGNGTAPPYAILGGSGAGFGEELQCQACGEFVGENDTSLREHARAVHLDRATLSCRVCGKKFSLLSNAMQHVVVHTGIAVLQCHDCRRQFVSETRLNLHREHHCKKLKQLLARGGGEAGGPPGRAKSAWAADEAAAAAAGEVVACRTCGISVLKTMAALREHARLHVDTVSLVCGVCGLQSTFLSNLIKHALLHVGVFLFMCDACGKRFPVRCRLHEHQKSGCRALNASATTSSLGTPGSFDEDISILDHLSLPTPVPLPLPPPE